MGFFRPKFRSNESGNTFRARPATQSRRVQRVRDQFTSPLKMTTFIPTWKKMAASQSWARNLKACVVSAWPPWDMLGAAKEELAE
jgi:hypothetical protein